MYARLAQDRNDEAAWKAVEHWVRIWARSVLARFGPEVINDAVADTCASVAITFERAHGAETFRGFVLGHWLNTRRRVFESRPAAIATVALESVDLRVYDRSDDGLDPDQVAWLHHAIEELPERQRRALVLRYFDGFSACEIGAKLDVSDCNARRLVFNALARLRQAAAAMSSRYEAPVVTPIRPRYLCSSAIS
jgi:RNA polymerase sigma factor (sigma-70 family)